MRGWPSSRAYNPRRHPDHPGSQSPKSVGEDLCKATKDWKGMNVTCKLLVLNRKVTTIPVSAML